jgi:hypothetical protein
VEWERATTWEAPHRKCDLKTIHQRALRGSEGGREALWERERESRQRVEGKEGEREGGGGGGWGGRVGGREGGREALGREGGSVTTVHHDGLEAQTSSVPAGAW